MNAAAIHPAQLTSSTPASVPTTPLAERTTEQLEDDLTGLAAHLNAVNFQFLELLAEFDTRGGYAGWGVRSCAHWLSWKCGIGLVAARDKVRVARALRELPAVSDAMARGRVSYSKVRALTRIATPETESFLLSIALNGTASHVERVVREYRKCERREELQEDNIRHGSRRAVYRWDDDGSLVIEARLPPEQGALLVKALEAAETELREEQWQREGDSAEASATTWGQRQADALHRCAEAYLAGEGAALPPGERHQVQVQVDAEALVEPQGQGDCNIQDGPAIPPETARRLTCDGSLVALLNDGDGSTLDVGRRTRAIPPAMRRALQRRDGGCRFPGCSASRFVDGHHIRHWADGGETRLDNLVLLCRNHHRLVHEAGFHVSTHDGDVAFHRPDGAPIPESPAAPPPAQVELPHPIDGRTAVPGWMGEPLDLTWCLTALFQRRASAESLH
jgi:hypothetical protein